MSRTKISLFVVSIMLALGLTACATGPQAKGYVTGVSTANRTITVDGQLIHVPKNISMTKTGNPIALQDIFIGNKVHVKIKHNADGDEATDILVLTSNSGKEGRK